MVTVFRMPQRRRQFTTIEAATLQPPYSTRKRCIFITIGYWLYSIVSLQAVAAKNSVPNSNINRRSKNYQKNILLLLTDDQDVLLGSFDTEKYMPKLHEKLRLEGATFVEGGLVHVPICCPNRASLLTGKYLHHGNLAINNTLAGNCYSQKWRDTEEPSTIAAMAQFAGYTTLYAGKYLNMYKHHNPLGEDSVPKGWDYWYGLEGNSRYYNYTIVERQPNKDGNATIRLHEHGDSYPKDYLPLVLESYTSSILPTLPEPWLVVVAWPTPHGPFVPEPKYSKEYPDAASPRNADFNASEASQLSKHWLLRQLGPITDTTFESIESIYKDRLRALKTVDNHVGSLLDWLEKGEKDDERKEIPTASFGSESSNSGNISSQREGKTGIDQGEGLWKSSQRDLSSEGKGGSTSHPSLSRARIDRTVVIYTSDNGFQFGQHRLSIDKRHLYEHDIRVPFVVRGPKSFVPLKNVTIPKETIVSTLDIAPTILEIILQDVGDLNGSNGESETTAAAAAAAAAVTTTSGENVTTHLRSAIDGLDGLSFWGFLQNLGNPDPNDPFVQRTDLLISYHGEGNPRCGLSECPAPLDGLWWMPDSYNNTYHCVRTLKTDLKYPNGTQNEHWERDHGSFYNSSQISEDSIYCVFQDDERFVEYYNLKENPHQMGNDYASLSAVAIERYERRYRELLS